MAFQSVFVDSEFSLFSEIENRDTEELQSGAFVMIDGKTVATRRFDFMSSRTMPSGPSQRGRFTLTHDLPLANDQVPSISKKGRHKAICSVLRT